MSKTEIRASHNITLRNAIEAIYAGQMFAFECVSYDKKRAQKSGKIIKYSEAQALWVKERKTKNGGAKAVIVAETTEKATDPQHRENLTLNVRIFVKGQKTSKIVKIHPILLTEFNGLEVLL